MRLQLPKIHDPENPHKYWVFEVCRSYTVAAEQKARVTYDNILRLTDDPDVRDPIKFLRQRELVHYQRFAECLGIAQDSFEDKKNFYLYNPAFDCGCKGRK